MMQEVSIMVAYDAHVVDRPAEEDALARLVAHSRPLRAARAVVGLFFLSLSAVGVCVLKSQTNTSSIFCVIFCITKRKRGIHLLLSSDVACTRVCSRIHRSVSFRGGLT